MPCTWPVEAGEAAFAGMIGLGRLGGLLLISYQQDAAGASDIERDLSGGNVLICDEFCYFGPRAIEIPSHLLEIIKKGPAHKKIERGALYNEVLRWLESLPQGNQIDGGAAGLAAA